MELANLNLDSSLVKAHLELFAFLLLFLPPAAFLSLKYWITARTAAKTKGQREWFVPRDMGSDAMRIVFSRGAQSVAFAHGRRSGRSLKRIA